MNAPYFRLSPELSVDVVLDETEDDKLLLVCWEAMVYIKRNHDKLVQIAKVLKQGNHAAADRMELTWSSL